MYRIEYQVTTLSPILITSSIGNTTILTTEKHIPGSVILGMFASKYITKNRLGKIAHTDQYFKSTFLEGGIGFGNAYISDIIDNSKKVFFPTPLSLVREKENERQYYDKLFLEEEETINTVGTDGKFCNIIDNNLLFKEVKTRLNFHHARDAATGTVAGGAFFNYESIEPDHTFTGYIWGQKDKLEKLISMAGINFVAFLGRSKNAQYGKVKFEIVSPEPKLYQPEINTDGDAILTLISDAIIYNENGYADTSIQSLETLLNTRIIDAVMKSSDVENFVSIWKLRKPSERCIKAGSCFKIEVNDQNQKSYLLELQKTGIGERKNEGYGRFVINWQVEEKLNLIEFGNVDIEKPSAQIPKHVKVIIENAIKLAFYQNVQSQAESNAYSFESKKLPSNSLIGRLQLLIDVPNFQDRIKKNLRKQARDQLSRCRNNSKTLLSHLEKTQWVDVEHILMNMSNDSKLVDLMELVSFKEQFKTFNSELNNLYIKTFLSVLRRIKKLKDTPNNG